MRPRFLVPTMLMVVFVFLGIFPDSAAAFQDPFPRILIQDTTLDNLVTPPGYRTATLGELGAITRRGTGPKSMLLIPGLGFGGEAFEPLMEALGDSYTMWAVTLAGFGGTPAPPTPPEGTSYAAQTWTEGALEGIDDLIQREDLRDIVVVGHWLTGAPLAIRVALRHPERVRAVVLLAGSARFAFGQMSLAQRVTMVDGRLSQGWFKTVTRETWDDNNFLPGDYAAQPVLGLRLWRQAASPHLHTWIRYLLESYAQDVTLELPSLRVPTLLLNPDTAGVWHDPSNFYYRTFTSGSWGDLSGTGVEVKTVAGSRIVMWADQLDCVIEEVKVFLVKGGG